MAKKIVSRTRREVYERWLRALRNRHYKQGQGTLKNAAGRFCCLGVLCDLNAKDGGAQWDQEMTNGAYCFGEVSDYVVTQLPENIQEFMGIDYETQDKLITLNDEEEYSFPKIANYIETEIMPKVLKNEL